MQIHLISRDFESQLRVSVPKIPNPEEILTCFVVADGRYEQRSFEVIKVHYHQFAPGEELQPVIVVDEVRELEIAYAQFLADFSEE